MANNIFDWSFTLKIGKYTLYCKWNERLLPRFWREDIKDFDSLVIMPQRRMHDSGYRCMSFVACKGDMPIVKLGGGSDVIHIDGIGGFGYKWNDRFSGCPQAVPPVSWSIDCLKTSGLMRLFSHGNLIAEGACFSSFQIFNDPKIKP